MRERVESIAILGVCVAAAAGLIVLFVASRGEKRVLAGSGAARVDPSLSAGPAPPFSGRPPAEYYRTGIRGDLFQEQAAASSSAAPGSPARSARASDLGRTPEQAAEHLYTGMVHIGGVRMALVEDPVSRVGRYLRVGDRLGNARVTAISPDSLALSAGRQRIRLARNQNYTLVPLSRSADFLQARPERSAPVSQPSQQSAPVAQPQAAPPAAPQTPNRESTSALSPAPEQGQGEAALPIQANAIQDVETRPESGRQEEPPEPPRPL